MTYHLIWLNIRSFYQLGGRGQMCFDSVVNRGEIFMKETKRKQKIKTNRPKQNKHVVVGILYL